MTVGVGSPRPNIFGCRQAVGATFVVVHLGSFFYS